MRAQSNGLELEYETFGRASDPPVVLVMGFTEQLTAWPEEFCAQLAGRGFHVVRFDNRDVGLSSKVETGVRLDLGAIFGGDASTAPYSIEDMADDTAGLIDALGFESAHVAGVSMGGMIVQSLAIRHPQRVRSLASIMSTTGDRRVGQASPEALMFMGKPAPAERDANIENAVHAWRALRSPGFPFDEARVRDKAARAYDRSYYPRGVLRQLAAIVSQRDRTQVLAEVRVSAVVIHGTEDPLVHVSGGEATARAIPGAKLVRVPGMGHDLPEGAWPVLIDAIAKNANPAG
jgi:pimeloyl-ACP methyl ester carboxylesterase